LPGEGTGGGQVSVHQPVLVAEALAALAPRPGQVVVDGTVGAGGHASRLLAAISPGGMLVGLDRDAEILGRAREVLAAAADRIGGGVAFRLFHTSFSRMQEVLNQEGIGRCDRVLLDLGVSSLQLDTAARGFSFSHDAALDMRMDRSDPATPTAAQWLARASEAEIARVLWEFGEERHSRRIARAVVAARKVAPIVRTSQLSDLVQRCVPRHGRIHPATRTFQAIRIHLNDELGELRSGLEAAARVLVPGGHLVVITFHSLEDRLVKDFLRRGFDRLHKKPITATPVEVAANPRARSAKLRAGVKQETQ
jgi:16S rRNA (cytosine1402-N4)-methyltransferase